MPESRPGDIGTRCRKAIDVPSMRNSKECVFVLLLSECLQEVWKADMGRKGGADGDGGEEGTAKSHDSGEL